MGQRAVPGEYVDELISAAIDAELSDLGYEVLRERPTVDEVAAKLCSPSNGPELSPELVVVDGADPAAVGIGRSFAGPRPALVLPGTLTEEQVTWLRHSSGVIESVYVIGSVPEDVRKQIAELIAGPLGYTTTHNPTAPADLY
jgi:hypothetical protein